MAHGVICQMKYPQRSVECYLRARNLPLSWLPGLSVPREDPYGLSCVHINANNEESKMPQQQLPSEKIVSRRSFLQQSLTLSEAVFIAP